MSHDLLKEIGFKFLLLEEPHNFDHDKTIQFGSQILVFLNTTGFNFREKINKEALPKIKLTKM